MLIRDTIRAYAASLIIQFQRAYGMTDADLKNIYDATNTALHERAYFLTEKGSAYFASDTIINPYDGTTINSDDKVSEYTKQSRAKEPRIEVYNVQVKDRTLDLSKYQGTLSFRCFSPLYELELSWSISEEKGFGFSVGHPISEKEAEFFLSVYDPIIEQVGHYLNRPQRR